MDFEEQTLYFVEAWELVGLGDGDRGLWLVEPGGGLIVLGNNNIPQ